MSGWGLSTQLHCTRYLFDERFLSIFNVKKVMRILHDRVCLLRSYVLSSYVPLHIMEIRTSVKYHCILPKLLILIKATINSYDKFLVSKETVMLCQWESETCKFGFIKQVDKSQIASVRHLKSWCFDRLTKFSHQFLYLSIEILQFIQYRVFKFCSVWSQLL